MKILNKNFKIKSTKFHLVNYTFYRKNFTVYFKNKTIGNVNVDINYPDSKYNYHFDNNFIKNNKFLIKKVIKEKLIELHIHIIQNSLEKNR